MPGRLVNKADFERLLGTRPVARSAHFAVHHVPAAPQAPHKPRAGTAADKLSTDLAPELPKPVDTWPEALWLGCVVPKRCARRAVTRNLIKRQVRSAFERQGAGVPRGLWLVRLREPFAVAQFVSARSLALAAAVRAELDAVLARVAR
jgi:ribonuclease P protein component